MVVVLVKRKGRDNKQESPIPTKAVSRQIEADKVKEDLISLFPSKDMFGTDPPRLDLFSSQATPGASSKISTAENKHMITEASFGDFSTNSSFQISKESIMSLYQQPNVNTSVYQPVNVNGCVVYIPASQSINAIAPNVLYYQHNSSPFGVLGKTV